MFICAGVGSGFSRQLSLRGSVADNQTGDLSFSANLYDKKGGRLLASAMKNVAMQNANLELNMDVSPEQGKKLQWGEKLNYTVSISNKSDYVMRSLVASVSLSGDELWRSGSVIIKNGGSFESVFLSLPPLDRSTRW